MNSPWSKLENLTYLNDFSSKNNFIIWIRKKLVTRKFILFEHFFRNNIFLIRMTFEIRSFFLFEKKKLVVKTFVLFDRIFLTTFIVFEYVIV
jgi:hypothetical protein